MESVKTTDVGNTILFQKSKVISPKGIVDFTGARVSGGDDHAVLGSPE